MIILNKLESMQKIKMLNLNHFPYIAFTGDNFDEVENFLSKYRNLKFAIRDSYSLMSKKFKNNLSLEQVVYYLKKTKNVLITLSGLNYKNHKKITGEILIYTDMQINLSITMNSAFTTRDASNNPDYSICTNIFDKRVKVIPYIDKIIDFIFNNNLFDIIVEFSFFDIPVGIKKENIIIWELRTNY